MAILHILVTEAETRATEAGIQRVRFQFEQDLRLVGAFTEEAFANGLNTAHLRQELTGQRQAAPIDPAQVVAVGAATDEGTQIVIEEVVRYAMDLEEFAEISQSHFAFGVGEEGVA